MANAHDMSYELIQFFGIMPVCLHYEKYQSSLCIQYRPIFKQLKDRNLLKKHTKNQEASSILSVGFALSKWPHLHRADLVTVPEWLSLGVSPKAHAEYG